MSTILSRLAMLAGVWVVAAVSTLPEVVAAEPPRGMTLRMRNGDFVIGNWHAVDGPPANAVPGDGLLGTLRWQSSAFREPLVVPWERIQTIQMPTTAPATGAPAAFAFELVSGETIYGDLKGLSLESIEVESRQLGTLRLPRSSVRQFFSSPATNAVVVGPQGVEGWYSARPKNPQLGMNPTLNNPDIEVEWVRSLERLKQWGDQDAPATAVLGAQLRSEFELPAKARIELELSWRKKAAFAVVVGGGLANNLDRTACRLEVWNGQLVLVREDDQVADVRPLLELPNENGSLRLHLYHDRAAGRLIVFAGGGPPLADLTFASKPKTGGGANGRGRQKAPQFANPGPDPAMKDVVSPVPTRTEPTELVITNVQGDLRLDGFRVAAWNGAAPASVDSGKPGLLRTDGQLDVAETLSYDPSTKLLRLKDSAGERVEALAGFSHIVMTDRRLAPTGNGIHLSLRDGDRLFGLPLPSPAGRLRLKHANIEQVVEIDLAAIRSVAMVVDSAEVPNTAASGGDNGTPANTSPANSPPANTAPAVAPKTLISIATAQLSWNGGSLLGTMVDGQKTSDSTGLSWKPVSALSPVTLRPDFSGRIVSAINSKLSSTSTEANDYATSAQGVQAGLIAGFVRVARGVVAGDGRSLTSPDAKEGGSATANAGSSSAPTPLHRVHLRTGEVIPCQGLAIDEQGLRIQSHVSPTQRIAHEQVKAIEMLPNAKPPKPAAVKRERLLMVPRVDRANPPTHIVRSRDADYLRGRLLQLDEDFLTFEVRSETKRIPRELVSHIIWVNADEVESAASGANDTGTSASGNASASASGNVNGNGNPGENVGSGVGKSASPAATVTAAEKTAAEKAAVGKTAAEKTVVGNANTNLTMLALRKDGVRIGLEPTRCENSVFTGTNRILGEVRVDMRDVDQFLIGGAIGEAGAQLPYAQWRWKPAALPKVATVQSDAPGGSRRPGTDSPLVGKPAPEFKLPMLAGKDDFELGKQRGRIVVLDFWATWCGPCLKTIPVLERVVREQPAEAKVDLIAVNLEEAPRQITAMLERHGWKLAVALDQDGAVASKYAANAIPQTVIVDREGKVARLFVGGGPQFEAELRAALTEILTPAMP